MARQGKERADLEALIADPGADAEITRSPRPIACASKRELEQMAQAIRLALLPKDAADERDVILEVRAGTGGDEAALFAGDLFRMYIKYAEAKGWKVEVLSASEGDRRRLQGDRRRDRRPRRLRAAEVRERRPPRPARAGDRGAGAHPHLGGDGRGAAGGRGNRSRHQRRGPQDRHDALAAAPAASTSTRPSSAIRITHLPTGIVVAVQEERSQHRNRAKAMALLRARILDGESQRASDERAQERRAQVGSGDRSQRIRTYNFPQGRVTDHRINLTLYSLDRLMEGEGLDTIIDALAADRQARLLAEQAER